MEGVGLGPALALGRPLLDAAIVGEQLEGGAPLLELHLPVQHDRGWHHHQVRTPVTPVELKGGNLGELPWGRVLCNAPDKCSPGRGK